MPEPDDTQEEARAALAPTLEATAAILPWVARPRKPRFPPALAKRWQALGERLADLWQERHEAGLAGLRPAVFELYAAALDLGDADCLRLAEALASASDRLEARERAEDPRLTAALAATFECLGLADSLEHPAFPERARHFAERLERCADPRNVLAAGPQTRTPTIDRLFVEEAGEWLEHMHEAFAALPPDAYAIKVATEEMACLAETLDLDDISALAGRLIRLLTPKAGEDVDLDEGRTRHATLALLTELESAVAGIAAS